VNKEDRVSTGLPGLDEILDSLRIGDNVVWRVEDVEDYRPFVEAYIQCSLAEGRRLNYMRFAQHPPLVRAGDNVRVWEVNAYRGFEAFTARIHSIIAQEGVGAFYVFDCLSDLLSAWATDLMVGNFFRVTCPYLFELDTVAYFAVLRGRHSHKTMARIRDTTQILVDLQHASGRPYVQPVKVWRRASPTMFLAHAREDGRFVPVANSVDATRLQAELVRKTGNAAQRSLDYWDRLFLTASDLLTSDVPEVEREAMVDQLCRVLISTDERILALARRHLGLEDLLEIKSRMIGTGYIGGKSVGMLLARKILLTDPSFNGACHLEAHDSFYVGSDVYYSYIVHNGWWPLLMEQKTEEGYFAAAAKLEHEMQRGEFPEEIRQELMQMLEYFGQYPIVIRSSSLLEDSFGNAFAGKYESYFCVNQGTPEVRYAQVENAVRMIFASTMGKDALTYRRQRGLAHLEEPMALLLQRVSGSYRKQYYFPDVAGVGVSYNTFVWSRDMDEKAGMLRLVVGLGTRAVDRVEGDYACLVALDHPLRRAHRAGDDARRFSQHDVDVLDVQENKLHSIPVARLAQEQADVPFQWIGVMDQEGTRQLGQQGLRYDRWIVTFEPLLLRTGFAALMQRLLKTLERAYDYPVDVEFTVSLLPDGSPRINVVQCRPLQTMGSAGRVVIPQDIEEERIYFRTESDFMGGSIDRRIERVIIVDGRRYSVLSQADKYEVARIVGRLNRQIGSREQCSTLLVGPGRWGTSTPSLGVPVGFAEISNIAGLVEVAYTEAGMLPDLSFGSHFFQDLVESDIAYVALFPDRPECLFRRDFLDGLPDAKCADISDSEAAAAAVKLCDVSALNLRLLADVTTQRLVCLRRPQSEK
jgi:hypothetical protein